MVTPKSWFNIWKWNRSPDWDDTQTVKVVPVHGIKTYGRRGTGIGSLVPQPHYPWGKSCRYVSNRRLDGLQSKSGCFGEQTDLLPLPGIKHHILVTTLTELPTPPTPNCCSHCFLISSKPNPGWFVTTVPKSFHIISQSHNLSPSASQNIKIIHKASSSTLRLPKCLLSSLSLSSSGFGVWSLRELMLLLAKNGGALFFHSIIILTLCVLFFSIT